VSAITNGVLRANAINIGKMQGKLLTVQEVTEVMNSQSNSTAETQEAIPKIKLVQTERNCWTAVLTKEERNLLEEFLDV